MNDTDDEETYLPECRTCYKRVEQEGYDMCEECRRIEQNAHNAGAFLAGLMSR